MKRDDRLPRELLMRVKLLWISAKMMRIAINIAVAMVLIKRSKIW
jgi:hypothetical protein